MAISSSELERKLKRELGLIYPIVDRTFYEEILLDESLKTFSDYFPHLVTIKITRADAIPTVNYSGKAFKTGRYRIPKVPDNSGIRIHDYLIWRDIEIDYLPGNDYSDVYNSVGNVLINHMFITARQSIPHTRSFYEPRFEEPDIIIIEPETNMNDFFHITMQAEQTLNTIPRHYRPLFLDLYICDVKLAIYNRFKFSGSQQIVAGVEVDLRLDELKEAESQRNTLIETFERSWYKDPKRFEAINLYNTKI